MRPSSPAPRADAKVSGPRRRLHHVGRALRVLALRLVSPVDRLVLIVNGKHRFPPIYLRRQAGPLHAFERVAGEYAGYLATLAGLTSSSHVLDVGCGAGALALALDERLGVEGRYRGFDVDRPVIAWAQRHLSGKRFEFRHHDYWNATYNPHGDRFAAWPADDGWADIVVLKSIFTHLLPEDVEFYLAETSRVLAPNGTALHQRLHVRGPRRCGAAAVPPRRWPVPLRTRRIPRVGHRLSPFVAPGSISVSRSRTDLSARLLAPRSRPTDRLPGPRRGATSVRRGMRPMRQASRYGLAPVGSIISTKSGHEDGRVERGATDRHDLG
jgi:SAM-dependent methyltransferase